MIHRKKVIAWMRANVREFVDAQTNEVNTTRLSEACAIALDLCEDDAECTIPDEVFEIAFEVEQAFDDLRGRIDPLVVRPRFTRGAP